MLRMTIYILRSEDAQHIGKTIVLAMRAKKAYNHIYILHEDLQNECL